MCGFRLRIRNPCVYVRYVVHISESPVIEVGRSYLSTIEGGEAGKGVWEGRGCVCNKCEER